MTHNNSMAEPQKKEMTQSEIPKHSPSEAAPISGAALPEVISTSQNLMSKLKPDRSDSWLVPLAGVLLAFSAISLIVQLLIAFS
jgi:hypothetical protein